MALSFAGRVSASVGRAAKLDRIPTAHAPSTLHLGPHRTTRPRNNLVCHSDQGAASDSGQYGSDDLPDGDLKRALAEALDLFNQANTMAKLQVQSELEQAFAADEPPSSSQNNPEDVPSTAMLNFWVEQGLSTSAATSLLEDLRASGRSYTMNQLSAKVQRLQRVLPDADIATLAVKDSQLLDVNINDALLNMICLVEAFPGKDIMSLLVRQPRLLWCEDLRTRVKMVYDKLQLLHPSKDVGVVREIIAENPELLYRIPDYYMAATLIDDLPIEIQNMMVLSDQGIGFLYRYYNNNNNSNTIYQGADGMYNNFTTPEN